MRQETEVQLAEVVKAMTAIASAIRQDEMDALRSGDHVRVIKHYAKLRGATEQIKTARKALEEMEENLSKVKIPDIVRDLRERTGEKPPFNIEGVGRVSVANRMSCSIIDDPDTGKGKGYEWLRGNGHESLVTETVNSSTLSAWAKDMIENNGIDPPDDIFKVSIQHYTSITKAK